MALFDQKKSVADDVHALALNGPPRICVAIPACDEQERIEACLEALARQATSEPFCVLVVANNCNDDTAEIVRNFARSSRLEVHLWEARWPPGPAPAALARRRSVNAAMEIAGLDGVVLMSDADSLVESDWIDVNMRCISQGADAVCGTISPNFSEIVTLPPYVLERGALEFTIEQAHVELESLLDPLSWNPWPRHRTESAASLACRVRMLVAVDGVPVIEPGEDRALVGLIKRAGGHVRHYLQAKVSTSCRLEGRARGGWADDLKERVNAPDGPCHANLEPTIMLFRRASLRGAMRADWPNVSAKLWSERLDVSLGEMRSCLEADEFEEAWARLEEVSPRLRRERIGAADLRLEIARASALLKRVRSRVNAAQSAVA